MRILLILIIIVCLGGSIAVFVNMMNSSLPQSTQLTLIISLILTYIINALCAHYLYKKAKSKKIEWALFGFIGNLNAILFYYCKKYVAERWTQGKSVFGD